MAEIIKHTDDSLYYIRHALRELPDGKYKHGNTEIDITLTETKNYSLLNRCQTAAEANKYRKELEKEVFKYNRKGLIKTIEIVIQCPSDCDDPRAFFETAYKYVCDKVLPMGERAVVTAQVHGDEHKYIPDPDHPGQKIDISKQHMHIIAVPAVPDTKHDNYDWKLSAHDITSKKRLKMFHPGLQKACDNAGLKATVVTKKSGDGKTISLSVKQLKEITDKSGIVLKKSLTLDNLVEILEENRDIKIIDKDLKEKVSSYEKEMHTASQEKASLSVKVEELETKATNLEKQLSEKDAFQEQIVARAKELLDAQKEKIEQSNIEKDALQEQLKSLEKELSLEKEKHIEIEKEKQVEQTVTKEKSSTWGNQTSWNKDTTWEQEKNVTVDVTWDDE